jgi:hypothetical protein
MSIWHLPNDFWTAIQNGLQFFIDHPLRRVREDPHIPTPKPTTPFPHGFNQPRNLLKQAYHAQSATPFPHGFNQPRNLLKHAYLAQSNIGWDNFTKGRITRHWQNYINHHLQNKVIKLPKDKWAAKLIIVLWEHLRRVWNFRNGIYHSDNNGQVPR